MTFRTGLRVGAMTDVGRVRAANQDALLVAGDLAAVADGMGGHAAGEVASALALHTLRDAVITDESTLRAAITAANQRVFSESVSRPSLHGMGTTLCVFARMIIGGEEHIVIANVGDSRGYRFADQQLHRLTRDHSYVADLVAAGELSENKARTHPKRNILTRALGVEPSVGIDTWILPLDVGDRYLLCSDGLINEVDEPLIAGTMSEVRDPQEAAEILVHLANSNGGRDNITVIVIDVTEVDDDDRESILFGAPIDHLPDELDDTLDAAIVAMNDHDELINIFDPRTIDAPFVGSTQHDGRRDDGELDFVRHGSDYETNDLVTGAITGHFANERTPFASSIASSARSLSSEHETLTPGGWIDEFEPDIHDTIVESAEADVAPLVDANTRAIIPTGGWIEEPPLAVVRPRRLTLRVLIFLALFAGVIYGGWYVVERAGRAGYTVRANGESIVLFEGPADKLLWVEPKQVFTYSVKVSDIPVAQRDDVRNGKHYSTRAEADLAVQRWREAGDRDGVSSPVTTLVVVPTLPPVTNPLTTPSTSAAPLAPGGSTIAPEPSTSAATQP
jgi:PPM family protein phosphatase